MPVIGEAVHRGRAACTLEAGLWRASLLQTGACRWK